MAEDKPAPRWTSYSSVQDDESASTDGISYAEAVEHQQTEFGSLPYSDDASIRAYRLNRREGYSPTESDKYRIATALASSLELTNRQVNEVYTIMSELNLAVFGSQRRVETVSLGVIAVIVNYDRFQHKQNPDADRISESQRFKERMKEFGIDYSDIGTAKRVVKQELRKMEYFG